MRSAGGHTSSPATEGSGNGMGQWDGMGMGYNEMGWAQMEWDGTEWDGMGLQPSDYQGSDPSDLQHGGLHQGGSCKRFQLCTFVHGSVPL